jgi:predicted RNA-binding protein YlxR (DUF448 family)
MPRHEPERTCIVTREAGSPAGLIRFVVSPDGAVVPDLKGRLPGRGAWVTATAAAVGEAVKRKAFGRALKAEVKAAPDLAAQIDRALVAEMRGALALANKAGAVITGFAKVEAAIAGGSVAALLHAAEAAEDGRRKLAGALRRRLGDQISQVPVIDVLTARNWIWHWGRSNVIHAALVAGPGRRLPRALAPAPRLSRGWGSGEVELSS